MIPPLESGDHLTRVEFERRYDAMPRLKKAELIEGVVYVPSPVRQRYHGKQHSVFNGWLFSYLARTPGVESGDNCTVRLDHDNEPQPDCVLFIKPEHGGQAVIDQDGYLGGSPDLVAEIASSSVSYDVSVKRAVYERNGVREYIVWRVYDREIDWWVLTQAGYERLVPGSDGVLRSVIFAGLWLDPAALLREDHAALLAVLERGLASPEHARFTDDLQKVRVKPAG